MLEVHPTQTHSAVPVHQVVEEELKGKGMGPNHQGIQDQEPPSDKSFEDTGINIKYDKRHVFVPLRA